MSDIPLRPLKNSNFRYGYEALPRAEAEGAQQPINAQHDQQREFWKTGNGHMLSTKITAVGARLAKGKGKGRLTYTDEEADEAEERLLTGNDYVDGEEEGAENERLLHQMSSLDRVSVVVFFSPGCLNSVQRRKASSPPPKGTTDKSRTIPFRPSGELGTML